MQAKTLFVALSLALPLSAQDDAHAGWYADFDVAMAAAKKSGKDLLVDFTGSDWCGWCIRLKNEVFDTEEFMAEAPKHFELVALDFPNAEEIKAKVPNPERNAELRDMHEIRGYPTILLMTNEGMVYGRTGYQEGGPTPYLEMLKEKMAKKAALKEAQSMVKDYESAEMDAQVEMLPKLLGLLKGASGDDPIAGVLGNAVESALSSGVAKKAGKEMETVEAMLAIGRVTEGVQKAVMRLDPKNEKGLREQLLSTTFGTVRDDNGARAALDALDEMLELGFKDKDALQNYLFLGARWCSMEQLLNDLPRAKKYCEKLKPMLEEGDRRLEFVNEVLGR